MATRQYIGARYVPKVMGDWVENTAYENLAVVLYRGASYTSKKSVPPTIGSPATNPEYWALTGNYNGQVELYRQETAECKDSVDELVNTTLPAFKTEIEGEMSELQTTVEGDMEQLHTTITGELNDTKDEIEAYVDSKLPVGTSDIQNNAVTIDKMEQRARMSVRRNSVTLTKNVVVIGDSYVHSDHNRYAIDQALPTVATTWNCHFYSDSGSAFSFGGADGHTFNDLTNMAYSALGEAGSNDIDYVLLLGGRNEAGGIGSPTRPVANLGTLVETWCINAHNKFPNAKIIMFPCLYDWRLPNTNLMKVIEVMNSNGRYNNCIVANGCFSWGTGLTSLYLYPNDIHPNQSGSLYMSRYIYNVVESGEFNCFKTRQDNSGNFGFYMDEGGISIMGEHTFNGTNNIMVAHNSLPEWLKYHGDTDWYFAGYNTVSNDTHATMCVLNSSGLTLAGGTVMPSGNKCRVSVKVPYTL